MNNLVMTDGKRVFTTTLVIAEGVGVEHRAVIALLKKHSNTPTLSTFQMRKVSRGGRPVEYAELNERQATFLVTLSRNSEKTVEFKERLSNGFIDQREIISRLIATRGGHDWASVRKDGKQVYFQKTDVIKDFVEYATRQGSKSAKLYYMNFAKMENSALFFFDQKYPNMREVMSIRQLMQVSTADQVIERAIKEGMDEGLHYRDIYKKAKAQVVAYAGIIGMSPILSLGA